VVTALASRNDDLTIGVDDARRVLGPALMPLTSTPPQIDPAVSDVLLGADGCLAVARGHGRLAVLLAAAPSAEVLQAIRARAGCGIDWSVAASPEVFWAAFEAARSTRRGCEGYGARVVDAALTVGASDVKIAPGDLPGVKVRATTWRRLGEFLPVTSDQACEAAAWAAGRRPEEMGEGPFDLDTSLSHRGVRLRANVYRTMRHWGLTLRLLPQAVPPLDSLGLPPAVATLSELERGLVFVSGPTGSGKSTTLAAVIDRINRTRAVAISTMELPVEYVHRPVRALIHPREVETDTISFTRAIDSALRQNPDVVLVGELRNTEEYLAAIRLARTGHLVFATLHAESAEEAVRGVVHSFPEAEQHLVRTELAASLKAVVVQLLVRGSGTDAPAAVVCEVLLSSPAVAAIIARGAFPQLVGEIRNSRRLGMCSMDDALVEAVRRGHINAALAGRHARDPATLAQQIGGTR
jgi:twitching motility protein PilT